MIVTAFMKLCKVIFKNYFFLNFFRNCRTNYNFNKLGDIVDEGIYVFTSKVDEKKLIFKFWRIEIKTNRG